MPTSSHDDLLDYVLATLPADQRDDIIDVQLQYGCQDAMVELTVRQNSPELETYAAALVQEFDEVGRSISVTVKEGGKPSPQRQVA